VGASFDRFIERFCETKAEIIALMNCNLDAAKAKATSLKLKCEIIVPNGIAALDFDYVVICSVSFVSEMYLLLVDSGISEDKIIFSDDISINSNKNQAVKLVDICESLDVINRNGMKLSKLVNRNIPARFLTCSGVHNVNFHANIYDCVRVMMLQLIAKQIENDNGGGGGSGTWCFQRGVCLHDKQVFSRPEIILA
jgi:hypothetical protein